jgi:hypothetical protein
LDFLLVILAGWLQHRQQQIIEFQNDQITSLLDQVGKKRILLRADREVRPLQWPVPADRTSMSSASRPRFGSHRVRKSRFSRIKIVVRVS